MSIYISTWKLINESKNKPSFSVDSLVDSKEKKTFFPSEFEAKMFHLRIIKNGSWNDDQYSGSGEILRIHHHTVSNSVTIPWIQVNIMRIILTWTHDKIEWGTK